MESLQADYERSDLAVYDPLDLLTTEPRREEFTTSLDPLPYKNADIQGPPLRDREINPEIMYTWARLLGSAPSGPQFVGVTDDGKLKTDAQVTATATFTDYSKRLAATVYTNSSGGTIYTVPVGFKAVIREIGTLMFGSPTTRVSYQVNGSASYYLQWYPSAAQFTFLKDEYYAVLNAGDFISIQFGTGPGISSYVHVDGLEIPV